VEEAVALEQVDPAEVADPRSDQVAEHAGDDDPDQRQFAFRDGEAGEQHDRLARDRDAGGLDRHQPEDGGDEKAPLITRSSRSSIFAA
jgi:hypothetical protein